jgi:hypothetical protein
LDAQQQWVLVLERNGARGEVQGRAARRGGENEARSATAWTEASEPARADHGSASEPERTNRRERECEADCDSFFPQRERKKLGKGKKGEFRQTAKHENAPSEPSTGLTTTSSGRSRDDDEARFGGGWVESSRCPIGEASFRAAAV